MKRFKLANVVLQAEDFLANDTDLLYRLDAGTSLEHEQDGSVRLQGRADFCTYFNAASVGKWQRYARLVSVRLHLEIAGDACELATIAVNARDADSPPQTTEVSTHAYTPSEDFRVHEVDMPLKAAVAGFTVRTDGAVRIRNAYYYTLVSDEQVRPVRLAVCTTTFRKEEFILPNIERIKRDVLAADDDLARNFHLFVVDNGQTLDAEALSDEHVSVIPNINAGGAGGFARGMMEAKNHERDFTHVVLMDDDVRMSTESFRRLFSLLSLATAEYARACVNGAMLELENPSLQFEDVSHVRWIGGYTSLKKPMHMDKLSSVARNEGIDVEVDNAYGAWWFSCIPMSYVEEMGLPMPFFVRCDDVEYGLRCKARYMTMNGICVWHARFEGRFNAAVVCYLYTRNMLVTMAIHPTSSRSLFMVSFRRVFDIFMRTMDYGSAELWLRGLEDYLKGPAYLMGNDGFELMSEASKKAEKFKPVDELDQSVMNQLDFKKEWLSSAPKDPPYLYRMMTILPHDRHWLPDFLLSNKPMALAPGAGDGCTPWYKLANRKTLVAMDPKAENGAVRRMDRARHAELAQRYRDLMREYMNTHQAVDESYRSKVREMTSEAFWREYLGLDEK